MSWLILCLAGLLEVCFAIGLKYCVTSLRAATILATGLALVLSVSLLAIALKQIPTGTAYAVWTGIGALGSLIAGTILFSEPVSSSRILCAILIVAGIAGLKASATDAKAEVPAAISTKAAACDAITESVLNTPASIPRTPLQFLQKLSAEGFKIKYHIVANGGAENINRGSFSSFGSVEGKIGSKIIQPQDFTFGIFLEPGSDGYLCVQNDFSTRLLVEVIATDLHSGTKNFWELTGDGKTADWHFRTNSAGIAQDLARVNMTLHPENSQQAQLFGTNARCSGCHSNGNLVMKELSEPHNDWFDPACKDSLQTLLGHFKLSNSKSLADPQSAAAFMFQRVSQPEDLAIAVLKSLLESIRNAAASDRKRGEKSADKSALRAVLAPLEMNLLSDKKTFKQRLQENTAIEIPTQFFVDDRLSGKQEPIRVPLSVYKSALQDLGSSFAQEETKGLMETQHAFLMPTRSFADNQQIDYLLGRAKLDQNLLAALLAIDWTTPVYSDARLQFMQYLPSNYTDAQDLRQKLLNKLMVNSKAAKSSSCTTNAIVKNLGDPDIAKTMHTKALALLEKCRSKARSKDIIVSWLKLASQRRLEIQDAQTSKNPRGTILEGGLGPAGFRRIFPQYREYSAKPHQLKLDQSTCSAH